MNAVDTNILVRFIVKDDMRQANIAYNLFRRIEKNREQLFVPIVVVLEVMWVLESLYDSPRADTVAVISNLLAMPIFQFETQPVIQKFITSARKNNFDLADLFLAHSAAHAHCDKVYTFDKKASKFKLFELLPA